LVEVKLGQLLGCGKIHSVVLSTNDEEIIDFAQSLEAPRLTIHRRAEYLASDTTSTDALVSHARELISTGHILWTHVTSPFVGSALYDEIVDAYRRSLTWGYDSLMTTTRQHSFLWTEDGPINYDRRVEKWPHTQTLTTVYEVNSAAFLAPVEVYSCHDDRIGERPLLYEIDRYTALDIDWEEDFVIAEQLLLDKIVNI